MANFKGRDRSTNIRDQRHRYGPGKQPNIYSELINFQLEKLYDKANPPERERTWFGEQIMRMLNNKTSAPPKIGQPVAGRGPKSGDVYTDRDIQTLSYLIRMVSEEPVQKLMGTSKAALRGGSGQDTIRGSNLGDGLIAPAGEVSDAALSRTPRYDPTIDFGKLSPDDVRVLTYTLLGEGEGEGPEGMLAIANVIHNRSKSPEFPDNPIDVVLERNQFSTWNRGKGGNQRRVQRQYPPGSDLYNTAQSIVQHVFGAEDAPDVTGGSLYYHNVNVKPKWRNGVLTSYGVKDIGQHRFYLTAPIGASNPAAAAAELLALGGSPSISATSDLVPLTYVNQGAHRDKPVKHELETAIQQSVTAVYGADYRVEIMSGEGEYGTRRHSTGVAGDVWIYDPTGHKLTPDEMVPMAQHWLATDLGSVGLPVKGSGASLHLDLIGGSAPGSVPLITKGKHPEGRFWFYDNKGTLSHGDLPSVMWASLSDKVTPNYAIDPKVVKAGLVPPMSIPDVATMLDVTDDEYRISFVDGEFVMPGAKQTLAPVPHTRLWWVTGLTGGEAARKAITEMQESTKRQQMTSAPTSVEPATYDRPLFRFLTGSRRAMFGDLGVAAASVTPEYPIGNDFPMMTAGALARLSDPDLGYAVDARLPEGMVRAGNIDIHNRPVVRNEDGSISTVASFSAGFDEGEVLLPTITPDGRRMTQDEAIQRYQQTGENLGIFTTPEAATKYAIALHEQQAREYATPREPVVIDSRGNQRFLEELRRETRLQRLAVLTRPKAADSPALTEAKADLRRQLAPLQNDAPGTSPDPNSIDVVHVSTQPKPKRVTTSTARSNIEDMRREMRVIRATTPKVKTGTQFATNYVRPEGPAAGMPRETIKGGKGTETLGGKNTDKLGPKNYPSKVVGRPEYPGSLPAAKPITFETVVPREAPDPAIMSEEMFKLRYPTPLPRLNRTVKPIGKQSLPSDTKERAPTKVSAADMLGPDSPYYELGQDLDEHFGPGPTIEVPPKPRRDPRILEAEERRKLKPKPGDLTPIADLQEAASSPFVQFVGGKNVENFALDAAGLPTRRRPFLSFLAGLGGGMQRANMGGIFGGQPLSMRGRVDRVDQVLVDQYAYTQSSSAFRLNNPAPLAVYRGMNTSENDTNKEGFTYRFVRKPDGSGEWVL